MDQTFDKIDLGWFAEQKVLTVALLNDILIFGTEKGLVSCCSIKSGRNIESVNQVQVPSKKPVEKILANNTHSVAYCLCHGEILVYPIPHLTKPNFVLKQKDDIVKMALNVSLKEDYRSILTISKKNKIRIYVYDPDDQSLKEKRKGFEIQIKETPEIIEWYDDTLSYKYKKKIYWLNIETQQPEDYEMDCLNMNYVKENLIVAQKEFGIFMGVNKVSNLSPITDLFKDILSFSEFKSYTVSFHDKAIIFYALAENENKMVEIQKINLAEDENGRFVLLSQKNTPENQSSLKLVVVSQTGSGKFKAYEIKEKPYEFIMSKLLQSGKIDDALAKMNDNVLSTSENKMEKIEKFFLDAAWVCIKQGNFPVAYKYARLANYNPFEFMYTFFNQLNLEIIHTDCTNKITKDIAKNQIELFIKSTGGGSVDNKEKPTLKFLMDLLLDKRNYLITHYKMKEQGGTIEKYQSSEMAIIDLSSSQIHPTVLETLNYINSTLVKVMIKIKEHPEKIAAIIDHPTFTCTGICDFSKDDFFSLFASEELKIALAFFHEKLGRYKQALEIWKNFGVNEKGNKGTIFANVAKERTKKIFYKFKNDNKNHDENMKLFEEYLPWLMMKSPEDAFEIVISTEFITIDIFLSNIVTNVESGMAVKNLKEKFLIFYNKKHPSDKYQTMLMELLIEKLFKMKNRDQNFYTMNLQGELKEAYDLFMQYLKEPNSCYSKNYILDKMKDTWLIEGEIYLYSELKMHSAALEKLIENATSEGKNNFKRVEEYCEENFKSKPEIFDMFLEMLIKKYKNLQEQGSSDKIKNIFEDEIINFMQKNKAVEKINPVKALEMLPDNLNVCDERLYDYLTNVIKEYTSLTNKYKIARNISDMALTYKEKEVIDEKKKFVTIDVDTVCDLCKKKIGIANFVVYPNMKIYHPSCAHNPSVCPTTGVDFSKKIMV